MLHSCLQTIDARIPFYEDAGVRALSAEATLEITILGSAVETSARIPTLAALQRLHNPDLASAIWALVGCSKES